MDVLPELPAPPAADRPLWEQWPGEPDLWYGRFQLYLALGPARSLRGAYRHYTHNDAKTAWNSEWSSAARRWQWRARALAYDAHQRELLALSERNMRLGLRQRRLAVIEETLDQVRTALDSAHLDEADEALARTWLPQLRSFLRELLAAERQEFERRTYTPDDPDAAAPLTADDLRAAQRQLEEEEAARTRQLDDLTLSPAHLVTPSPRHPVTGSAAKSAHRLLVCAGADSGLLLDLAVLRAVRTHTGLEFMRVLNATSRKFAAALRRERELRRPVQLLHLALHTSAQGVEFVDGPADGNWLSERLAGVRVLLLASCAGDELGDWLGVVPFVVTLNEAISHEDAAALAHHFWQGVGLHPLTAETVGAALNAALALCPPAVAEYVVRHW